jgi:hypothetical protein
MELCFLKNANSYTSTHEITRILREPKVQQRVHNSPPPLVSILNQNKSIKAVLFPI